MKITREKACQRLHHRVKTPLGLHLNGGVYQAIDWSLGGLRIGDWSDTDSVLVGQIVPCQFHLPFQGFDIGLTVELEVLRIDKEQSQLAGQFVELGDREKELMQHFIEQLIRGAMVPVADTIMRIDSPVTPVSTTPDASPVDKLPNSRIPKKLIAMSAFYLIGGLLLFSLVALTIYNNFLSLRVETAMTSKPVEPIIALRDGRLINASVTTDQWVREGDELFQMSLPAINRELDEARIEVERNRLELAALRKKYALAAELNGSHLDPEARRIEIDIDYSQQQVAMANENLLALYRHKDELNLNSPGDGRVIRMFRLPGSQVQRGEMLALFERSGRATVVAYLSEEEVKGIRMDQVADIYSSTYGAQWQGVVTEIMPAQTGMDLPYTAKRGVAVRLALVSGNVDPSDVVSGSPVSIQFHHPLVMRVQELMGSDALQRAVL
jgi:multidrug resistance efflux pump